MLNNERQAGAEVDSSTTADTIPSASIAQNPMLPAVFRQYMDDLRRIFLSPKYSEKERHDFFLDKLNGISRWVDKEHENLVRHVVIFDQVAYLIPTHVYNDLMYYYAAYSKAVRNGTDDLDGYDECNDLYNYKEWIKRHYTPISQPSDNLDKGQLNPVELDNLPF